MDERFSQRTLRALLIAIPFWLAGMCACSAFLSGTRDAESALCLSALFVGAVALVISWLIAGQVRKQRFVHVPRYSDVDTYDLEDEKPKRGS